MISPIDFILKHNTVALTKRYVQETLMGNNTNRQGPHEGVRPRLPEDTLNEHDNASIEFLSQVAQQRMTNVEERMEPSKEAIEEPPTFPDTGEGEERSGEQIEADERAFDFAALQRRVHDQNLEILRLEGELQAAQAAYVNGQVAQAESYEAQLSAAQEQVREKDTELQCAKQAYETHDARLAASQREVERLKSDILEEQVKYAKECLGMIEKPLNEICRRIVGAYTMQLEDGLSLQVERDRLAAENAELKQPTGKGQNPLYETVVALQSENAELKDTVESWRTWHSKIREAIGSKFNERTVTLEAAQRLQTALDDAKRWLKEMADCARREGWDAGGDRKVWALEQADAFLAAQPQQRMQETCGRCSHARLDHADFGKGGCQVPSGCDCFEFVIAANGGSNAV